MQSFFHCRLDYCNVILTGNSWCSDQTATFSANYGNSSRPGAGCCDHVTPVLHSLHWSGYQCDSELFLRLPSSCPSICLSHAGIDSKWWIIWTRSFQSEVAQLSHHDSQVNPTATRLRRIITAKKPDFLPVNRYISEMIANRLFYSVPKSQLGGLICHTEYITTTKDFQTSSFNILWDMSTGERGGYDGKDFEKRQVLRRAVTKPTNKRSWYSCTEESNLSGIRVRYVHSLTAALDQLRVIASSTSNDPGPRSITQYY